MQKKALLTLSALVLIACVMIGATLAYLTDTVGVNVNYAYGTVRITVDEPSWRPDAQMQADFLTDENKAVLYPGRTFKKDPVVNTANGSIPCYVRLTVVIDDALAKVVQVPEPNINAGWELKTTSTPNTYHYVYSKIVDPGTVTPPAFTEVKVSAAGPLDADGNPDNAKHAEYLAAVDGDTYILVTAEAIQSATFNNVEEAFIAYDSGYGI